MLILREELHSSADLRFILLLLLLLFFGSSWPRV